MAHSIFIAALILLSCKSQQVDKSFGNKEQAIVSKQRVDEVQVDTIKRLFQVTFKNLKEIRIGSPYNSCDIEIVGTDKVQLPTGIWQDKFAWSDDSKSLVLVKWELDGNLPLFKLIKVDSETEQIEESIKMLGAINSLTITGKTVRYNKFYYNKAKSKDKVCCEVEEVYTFK